MKKEKLDKLIDKSVKETLKEFSENKVLHPTSYFDLDKISDDELKRQSLGVRIITGYGGNFFYNGKDVIKEEAIETISVKETINDIKKKFSLSDWQISTEKGANNIELIFIIPISDEKLIIDAMLSYGWSESCKENKIDRLGNKWVAISFDPMFQDSISDEAKQFKYLFHWSPKYNLDNILKIGIVPKSENELFKYPSRIHLMKGNISTNNALYLGKQLYLNNTNPNNDGNYVLFSVETSKLPNDMEIYYDPRYEDGYYVKETIPPIAIKIIKKYNFKQ